MIDIIHRANTNPRHSAVKPFEKIMSAPRKRIEIRQVTLSNWFRVSNSFKYQGVNNISINRHRKTCRSKMISKLTRVLHSDTWYCSLTHYDREKCYFWVKFSKWRFWWIYTFLNLEASFLALSLSVCGFVLPLPA